LTIGVIAGMSGLNAQATQTDPKPSSKKTPTVSSSVPSDTVNAKNKNLPITAKPRTTGTSASPPPSSPKK